MSQKVLERDLENYLRDELNKLGVVNIKGQPINAKGLPDRIVFGDQIYFVEIKVGKDGGSYYQQTKIQKYWEQVIKRSNGNYRLLVGKEAIINFIEEIKKALN